MKKRNQYARSLRLPLYRHKIIPDKREQKRYDQSKDSAVLEDAKFLDAVLEAEKDIEDPAEY